MNANPKGALNSPKLPKQRDLLVGKKFRDSVKKWGEPNVHRRRLIIVPSIACEARDVAVNQQDKEKGSLADSGAESSSTIWSGKYTLFTTNC